MGYTFRGSNSTISLFCLPFQWGYTFRGSNSIISLFCLPFQWGYTFRGSNSIISLFCLPFQWGTPLEKATLPFVCFACLFNGVNLQGKQLYHLFVLPPFSMGYTFRVSNSTICVFCLPFQWGQLLKDRICSCRSKFFPFRVDLF